MAVDPNADGALRADGTNTSISTPTTGCSHSSESGMREAQGRRWGRRCGQPRAVKATVSSSAEKSRRKNCTAPCSHGWVFALFSPSPRAGHRRVALGQCRSHSRRGDAALLPLRTRSLWRAGARAP